MIVLPCGCSVDANTGCYSSSTCQEPYSSNLCDGSKWDDWQNRLRSYINVKAQPFPWDKAVDLFIRGVDEEQAAEQIEECL